MELDVYGMTTDKDNWARADKLQQWFREGGVLIIGYDLFRNLTNEANKKFKSKHRKIFNE
jgi:transcriptional regulator ATRX